jgi:hypothetical protein
LEGFNIVMGVRAQQKKTRRSLVEAAFSQLSAERSFAMSCAKLRAGLRQRPFIVISVMWMNWA